ncbi:hypothetical protein [Paracoccus beibuensis]|uniref:hypothetical protein n=1 Tax=Paracoccus beibuensis TaxID=547602 RepID=UPI0022407A54|nr:hypothetical protein [Paracoccus beibuensis]
MSFQESVTLPNGMQLDREFDWNRYGRWDLSGLDGKHRLVRDVELVCFDDRYVFVQSYDRALNGLYDAKTDSRIPVDNFEATHIKGLGKPGEDCGGYYTSWLGPGLLRDNGRPPLVPLCAWLNIENNALRYRTWFDRPCAPGPWSSLSLKYDTSQVCLMAGA